MKRWHLLLAALLCAAVLAGCGTPPAETTGEAPVTTESSPVAGKKVAYIMLLAPSDIFQMWSQSAQETAEGLGMDYDVFFCNGSDQQWQDTITQCAQEGYDGLLLSHGGQAYAYTFLKELTAQYPELKIVTFDTQFLDSEGQTQTLEGVTQFFQRDTQLTKLLLDYLCNDLYPEKKAAGEPIQVLKVWVGPGYLAAFDRREGGYAAYEAQGLIHTVETIGPEDLNDAEASMAAVTAEVLAKYSPGEIDAIWCCYDLYAAGVYTALTEGGYDIPLVSVDICNADLEKMAQETSPLDGLRHHQLELQRGVRHPGAGPGAGRGERKDHRSHQRPSLQLADPSRHPGDPGDVGGRDGGRDRSGHRSGPLLQRPLLDAHHRLDGRPAGGLIYLA